jgi:prephenate dehydratase
VDSSLGANDLHSGHVKENFEKMLETLKRRTETVRYLGSWEDALGR